MELWKGRFQKALDPKTNDFNSSISVDSRMFKEDIEGSIAHATMLGAAGIIAQSESEKICAGLEQIKADIENGTLLIDPKDLLHHCPIYQIAQYQGKQRNTKCNHI